MDNELRDKINLLINEIVLGNYAKLAADGRSGRLTVEDLKNAVAGYGRTLITVPPEGWSLVEEYPSEVTSSTIAVDVPLWTMEEGRSDLTLSLTAKKTGESYDIAIDDLHVL